MRYVLNVLLASVWAIWLGGLVGTFIFGGVFFLDLKPEIAGPAANTMFHVFGKVELVLALASLGLAGGLVVYYPSKPLLLMLMTLVAAGAMAVTTTFGFLPVMDSLRSQGKTHSVQFEKFHHRSQNVMGTEAVILLISGALGVTTISRPLQDRREISMPLSATLP